MKSIIQEASSIAKAIDQAWHRAGKPQEFTVKVFEEPQRSIFGLTVRSAKIAFFFDERKITAQPDTSIEKPEPKPAKEHVPNRPDHGHRKPAYQKNATKKPAEKPFNREQEQPSAKKQSRKKRSGWNDELINATKQWIDNALRIINVQNVSYETSVIGNNLNIQFKNKLLETEQKERLLFSSFAHLIMLGLSQSFKRRFPNLKIILKSAN